MKVAAQNLVQNSSIDNGHPPQRPPSAPSITSARRKSADGALQRFDKSLEEFYALCDQLELCLVRKYPKLPKNTQKPPVRAAGAVSGEKIPKNCPKIPKNRIKNFLCEQLELCLRLAHECLAQSFDSAKHAPALVPAAPKGEGGPGGGQESLPYTQYLPLIKAQIAGAKDIHNALLEGTNKITGKLPPPGGP
ncbi:mediator of RNA polymerase II transcription subunit 29-like [Passer domesticus]|uniref:mediator of RNA polymerase II transcription subunit 29-like n=1 Tax=Passer domesticus TaxID=48849 RepID=UPI0030FE5F05